MMNHSKRVQCVNAVIDRSMRRRSRAYRQGFTLVQLLGVIVILAIPATILFPVIATPTPGEIKAGDDSSDIPAQDRKNFIKTVACADPNHERLVSEINIFHAWIKETQGAEVSFPSQDHGRLMIARFSGPSTRKSAVVRARRLHWYYTYLRRSYFPGKDSIVKVVGSNGDTLAMCDGTGQESRTPTAPHPTWLRWASARLPFPSAMHQSMAARWTRIVSEAHRL